MARDEYRDRDRAPLSHPQQRVWFLDRLQEGRARSYNQSFALRLVGALDGRALREALRAMLERHETLRTRFIEESGQPVQIVDREVLPALSVVDARGATGDAKAAVTLAALRHEMDEPFDLARGPVVRFQLLRVADDEHLFVRTVHHIANDGWSVGVWNRELALLYGACRRGAPSPLAVLPRQYRDFARWQRQHAESDGRAHLDYWQRQLAGAPGALPLPTDRPRPEALTSAAGRYHTVFDSSQLADLQLLCRRYRVTIYMVLLAALAVVLGRHSGADDVVIGSPVANRRDPAWRSVIGLFVNLLALRLRVHRHATLEDVLQLTRRTVLAALRHQDAPFERVVEIAAPVRQASAPPLFQVLFACQNAPFTAATYDDLAVEPVERDRWQTGFDLEIRAFERADGLKCTWYYNSALFDEWRIVQLCRHHQRVLRAMVENPMLTIGTVPLLDAAERHHLLNRWATPRAGVTA